MGDKRARHSVCNVSYNFVWTQKSRRPILVDRIADSLTGLISDIDSELDGEFIDLTVQPDHVHLFCTFPPTITPYQIIYRINNLTASALKQEFLALKSRLPNIWTRSYYASTAGERSSETIQRYIEEQEGK